MIYHVNELYQLEMGLSKAEDRDKAKAKGFCLPTVWLCQERYLGHINMCVVPRYLFFCRATSNSTQRTGLLLKVVPFR